MSTSFLPVCDLLFNFISVTFYFCALAFDLLTVYTFYNAGYTTWTSALLVSLLISLITCQTISLKWFYEERGLNDNISYSCSVIIIHFIHFCGCGVLWRYSQLFSPVNIMEVKREMRNLCILRLIHSFIEAKTFLLVLGYMAVLDKPLVAVNYVSLFLSLFNICWSVASFNKNVYEHNVHKLVLTWIGVIFQFIWRLGTLIARFLALIIYTYAYGIWIFLVVLLHWMAMFTWLRYSARSQGVPEKRNYITSIIVSYIHIFCFLNLSWGSTKLRIGIFYSIIFTENVMLTLLWCYSLKTSLKYDIFHKHSVLAVVISSFIIGIVFMLLYYKFFHVKKLSVANALHAKYEEEMPTKDRCSNSRAVFNCAFKENYTKKKKMPRVIPVPPMVNNDKSNMPFWKEPLPQTSVNSLSETKFINEIHQDFFVQQNFHSKENGPKESKF